MANVDGAQMECAWLLGISYQVTSQACWSHEHVYFINAVTSSEDSILSDNGPSWDYFWDITEIW